MWIIKLMANTTLRWLHHLAKQRFLLFFAQQKISKRYRWKTEFFACYFSKTKCRSAGTFAQWCFSCRGRSVCQRLAWSCWRWKSAQDATYALFARKPSIVQDSIYMHLCVAKMYLLMTLNNLCWNHYQSSFDVCSWWNFISCYLLLWLF